MDKINAQWKIEGIFKADAQKVAKEIGNKEITPQEILEKARNEKSELHKCFEWDDSLAAEKYRLIQARNIIRNLVYLPTETSKEPIRVYQITSERKVYAPVKMIVQNVEEYEQLLERAKAELQAFKKRYQTLTELSEIFEEIDKL